MSDTEEHQLAPPPVEEPVEEIPPAHGPEVDSDGESVLSDIDDEVFEGAWDVGGSVIPIDEETVHAIGKHKIKRTPSDAAASGTGKKKERRRRDIKRRREEEDDGDRMRRDVPEVELTPAEKARRDLDNKINAALKGPKKKKKKNDVDLEEYNDELIINLKTKMIDAANRDADAIDSGQPAVHKLAMLDDVKEIFQRPNLMAIAMDNNLLEAMRRWLEPLPNKSLPAYSIQKLMFEIMGKMKITTDYLRESGIGKVVMFYTKDKRPQLHIKREADRLIGEWSRPILGRSDDYHSREIPMADRDHQMTPRPRQRQQEDEEHNPLAPPPRNQNRTRLPVAMPRSYDIAPQNRVVQGHNPYAKQLGSAGEDMIRRMKAKKQAQNKGRKSGMIIG